MITPEHLKSVITERLEATHVEVADISGGCGQAFEVTIVSPKFIGKNRLIRHRLVNSALKEEIASIHAFTQVNIVRYKIRDCSMLTFFQKSFTPEEWENKQ